MGTATRHSTSVRRGGLTGYAGLLLALSFFCPAATARGEEAAGGEGLFVTVQNPITSDVYNRVRETTGRALDRWRATLEPNRADAARRPLKIVYDFNPDNRPAAAGDFGACYQLAEYLLTLHDVTTIAFVHNDVTRHTVLPVLACKEVVMAKEAKLGNVLSDQAEVLTPPKVQAYLYVARGRGLYPAVVLKMLDKDLAVVESRTAKGDVWYHDARANKAETEAEARDKIVHTHPQPVFPAGGLKLFTAGEAETFKLCKLHRETRQEVAQAYGLHASSLREDPLLGRSPSAWRVEVRGAVNRALQETLTRRIRRAVGRGANVIILELRCAGGDTVVAGDLARFLADLKDDQGERPVLTIAYIPERAPDTAVFLALGCSEIVMHRGAEIGDFSAVVTERRQGQKVDLPPENYQKKLEALQLLARERGYPEALVVGMMNHQAEIYSARHRTSGEWRLFTKEELDALKKDHDERQAEFPWAHERLVKRGGPEGELLVLKGEDPGKDDARKLGLAHHVVGDVRELYTHYGINPEHVRSARGDWLDDLAAFLTLPWMSVLLVMVGITCLILELKLPGVGLPAVIAALCFVLFFWAHSQFAGQITMLAVLLFALGLILLGLEIFVLPGFGIPGISGIVLVLGSLGLVAYGQWPQTSEEWAGFGQTLGPFGLSMLGAVVAAFVLGRYLPHLPYVNRLILKPQGEATDELSDDPLNGLHPDYSSLLGAIGVAATPLRPAGKVQFGEEYIDVVAEGSYVQPGTRVQVVEVEGNRVVVKEVV